MKYIDADRLKAEIEKRLKNTRDYMNGAGMKYKWVKYYKAQGKESAYDALLNVLDSLQQEQPDFPTTDEQIKEFLATHPKIKVPEKYKNPDWLLKKQEKQDVDLEKEFKEYVDDDPVFSKLVNRCAGMSIAHHFAKWGAEHLAGVRKMIEPEVDLEKVAQHVYESWMGGTMDDVRRDMVELGKVLNARKV